MKVCVTQFQAFCENVKNFSYLRTPKYGELIEKTNEAFFLRENFAAQFQGSRADSLNASQAYRNYFKADKLLERCAKKYNDFLQRNIDAQAAFDRLNKQSKV